MFEALTESRDTDISTEGLRLKHYCNISAVRNVTEFIYLFCIMLGLIFQFCGSNFFISVSITNLLSLYVKISFHVGVRDELQNN